MLFKLIFGETINHVLATNNALDKFNTEYIVNKEYINTLVNNSSFGKAKIDILKREDEIMNNIGKNKDDESEIKYALDNKFWLKQEYLDYELIGQSLNSEIECMTLLYNKLDTMFKGDLLQELNKGMQNWVDVFTCLLQEEKQEYIKEVLDKYLRTYIHSFYIAVERFFFYCEPKDSPDTYLNKSLNNSWYFVTQNKDNEEHYKNKYLNAILNENLTLNLLQSRTNFENLFKLVNKTLIKKYGDNYSIKKLCYEFHTCSGLYKSFENLLISIQNMLLKYMFLKDVQNNLSQEEIQESLNNLTGSIREVNVDMLMFLVNINEVKAHQELDNEFNIFEYVFNKQSTTDTTNN